MLFASRPLLPHGSAAGFRANNCGSQHEIIKNEANGKLYVGGTRYARAERLVATRLPRRSRTDAAGHQGRVDLDVCARCSLSAARGAAEAEPLKVAVDLDAR